MINVTNDPILVAVMCPCCGEGEYAPYRDVDPSEIIVCNYCGERASLQEFVDMAKRFNE